MSGAYLLLNAVVRWQNFARTRVPTMCRTCVAFYVYTGRRYDNNNIIPKLRTCRPTLLLGCAGSVGGTVGSRPIPAGWLAGPLAVCWAATVTWQACRYLISPLVGSALYSHICLRSLYGIWWLLCSDPRQLPYPARLLLRPTLLGGGAPGRVQALSADTGQEITAIVSQPSNDLLVVFECASQSIVQII